MNSWPDGVWKKLLVWAVHPDDESLAAGGLIQRALAKGAEVRVVIVTDGENNPWPQRYVERRWQITAADRTRWGDRRRREAVAALASLGVPRDRISFWGYPDQGMTNLLRDGDCELIDRIAAEITREEPSLLIAPAVGDHHPDHSALAVLVQFALDRVAFAPGDERLPLGYIVHPRDAATDEASFQLLLSPVEVATKREAILCHASQLALSRRRFLSYARSTETFQSSQATSADTAAHPVIAVEIAAHLLCLRLKPLAATAFILLAGDVPGRSLRLSLRFDSAADAIVYDDIAGKEVGRARRNHGSACDEIHLPAALFAGLQKLAIKIGGGRRFYDRNGWRLLPLPPAPAPTPADAAAVGAACICSVIPCYNLAATCGPIVRAAATYSDYVIAINDGSQDDTEAVLRRVAEEFAGRVQVITFPFNRGKGVGLMAAFRRALSAVPFDVLITLDGDGQHRPEDIPRLARAVTANTALVIGERLARAEMPLRSRFGNTLTAGLVRLLYPRAPIDTQSGYRAFSRAFLSEVVAAIDGGRYETEFEILLLALRRGRRLGSVTIPTVYLDGNRLSHFRPLADSWRIYRTLVRRKLTPAGERSVRESWWAFVMQKFRHATTLILRPKLKSSGFSPRGSI